ncbi:DUF3570 domain-containing protein [Microvirga sp. STS02]|uniref:DUF3570 domain-containing protein n=1 Tax=Hymenobacter negativus TaxID=2795026 RepID=UPI0018DC5D79|nr:MULTISPECIES: DUF3570 domain-containing protein [Bacteria]MBH8568683.1 DUF3570 domain-containing protein [Hymenobacter negativus]MBR7208417.1 DUF3570 domain-containing protein [Microvirga sp. STS02]
MKKLLFVLLTLSASATTALAQTGTTQNPNRIDGYGAPVSPSVPVSRAADEATIDIIGGYYQQDGSHGAVEGGRGTQQLTDVPPAIIVNVPLDTVSRLTVNVGADFYASASTDRIDFALSTPSAHDVRYHGDFGYSREQKSKGTIWGVGTGVSKEYDYLSFNLAGSFAKTSQDGNRQLSLAGQVFFDRVTLIQPLELREGYTTGSTTNRGEKNYGTDTRQTYNFTATYSQVLAKRLQAAISTELVSQNGLLSTPFHRVYFRDNTTELNKAPTSVGDSFSPRVATAARIENLPRARFKYPVSLRVNYYATDLVQVRAFYRFYNDNFGITAHTFELELPVKITPFFVVYPFYRYHTQTAARYFAPFMEHSINDTYYTSDYDLSAFSANKVGLGLRYSPVYGIGRFHVPGKNAQGLPRVMRFKSLDLRYANYQQTGSTIYTAANRADLKANIISFDLGFAL